MAELTTTTRLVWKRAAAEAARSGAQHIEPTHVLAALAASAQAVLDGSLQADEETTALKTAFTAAGCLPSAIHRAAQVQHTVPSSHASGGVIHRSPRTRLVFERAESIAGQDAISSIHLLAATLEDADEDVLRALRRVGSDHTSFREKAGLPTSGSARPAPARAAGQSNPEGTGQERLLEQFGKDLTEEARQGRIPDIIGRRQEILETVQALARKKKNNPVLVGDPGVGKSAVVEALALRAVQGKDPQVLGGRRIIELNMGSLLAGTSLRGQFEERLTKIIEEASEDDDLILFIDEIHTIMGAGGGSADAANLLKPAMARGTLKLIGATTIDEYRRFIEKDPALDRRFERVRVDEPPREEAIEMLKGVARGLAKHHQATYLDETIETAVDLSMRLDVDHRLPDKAIDLLDRAGAQATVSALSMNPADFQTSADMGSPLSGKVVTPEDIAHVLAQKMGMPRDIVASHLSDHGGARMLEMEAFLGRSLKGQDEAIHQVSERMILAHAPVMERRGPLATMLFLGPSGVGKTELAKQLALFLFGSDKNLIRFDMSEFKGEHTVSKLIGSPPGYVGSEEEGQLTGQIRSKPYSVVLLDEVEKAHQRVYDVFLQVFDEGRITDAKGRLCDARNCIFILTTNVRPDVDESADRNAINEALKTWFRPELINRIDEIVPFVHLSADSIRGILDGLFAKMQAHVKKQHGVELSVDGSARDLLTDAGYNPEYGAREMRRTLERLVQIPLSRKLLSGELKTHPRWVLTARDGTLTFEHA